MRIVILWLFFIDLCLMELWLTMFCRSHPMHKNVLNLMCINNRYWWTLKYKSQKSQSKRLPVYDSNDKSKRIIITYPILASCHFCQISHLLPHLFFVQSRKDNPILFYVLRWMLAIIHFTCSKTLKIWQCISYHWRIRGERNARDAPRLISFIFMEFSTQILSNNRFSPQTQGWRPRLGNPGSATDYFSFLFVINIIDPKYIKILKNHTVTDQGVTSLVGFRIIEFAENRSQCSTNDLISNWTITWTLSS